MPRNVNQTCKEIVNLLENNGYSKKHFGIITLRKAISIKAGASDLTLQRYCKYLQQLGYIKEVGVQRYKILRGSGGD